MRKIPPSLDEKGKIVYNRGMEFEVIAHIHTDFKEKFGIPRQSGLTDLKGKIIFVPKYRNKDALRGIEGYSHLWLLWEFSEAIRSEWSPTVRPPKLGGNTRVGVFATRSPFRPNPVGLSSVSLEKVDYNDPEGPVLFVAGVDLLDGTPIYDVKPYLPYTDAHPEAKSGFAVPFSQGLDVSFPQELLALVPFEKRSALLTALKEDPRPSYQDDPKRVYGMRFAGLEIKFSVQGNLLTVLSVQKKSSY